MLGARGCQNKDSALQNMEGGGCKYPAVILGATWFLSVLKPTGKGMTSFQSDM